MTGEMLFTARRKKGWTQVQAAEALGVSQGYVALLEQGTRQPSDRLRRRLAKALDLPAVAPTSSSLTPGDFDALARALAHLGYPGFRHLQRSGHRENPAALLFAALAEEGLEARLAEALPWLVMTYADLDWEWLVPRVKQHDLQNRLGFVLSLARRLAEREHSGLAEALERREAALERSRLVREDVFGRTKLTDAEKHWLRNHRPPAATHWNMLSTLSPEHLSHVG
jgi:transcriptional regulator with XRE-family HTH domain